MAIITLTTDLGNKDYYVAAIKGRIVSSLPTANIIEISNNLASFDHYKAAYLVSQAHKYFPEKTIHIVGVIDFNGNSRKLLVADYNNQFFVCYDTGFFSLLFDDVSNAKVYEIEVKHTHVNNLSPIEDLVDVAIKLAQNKALQIFGKPVSEFKQLMIWKPIKNTQSIQGNIIDIDKFGNLITNVTQDLLTEYLHFKRFEIQLQMRNNKVNYISKSYADVEPGTLLALFNYSGNLELAVNQGSAQVLFGLKVGDKININFS